MFYIILVSCFTKAILATDAILRALAVIEISLQMYEHAHNLEFEEAARLRDYIKQLRDALLGRT